ncbi:hypothetical protein D915_004132 [Fasciola hepatica]|uniref:Protein kinase domain-containing protein n=1 Tax=Fasciola hepatica TaxID=6192 RepID=A0A2H1CHR1_FASHE|nr:hypothetical protein D915_004132 [Fasciola hepatica]
MELYGQLGTPVFVDYMCNDELCYFFRCRTAADQLLVIKYMMVGSFYKDQTLATLLQRRYAEKVTMCIRQINSLRPHTSVVRLSGSHAVFGLCSVTSEFHPQGNLFNWLANHSHITLWTLCKLIQHVCVGMAYLHRNQIYHGNLGFRDLLFKSFEPESVAIVLDVSVRALIDQMCSPYVYNMDRCPPELFGPVCQIAKCWTPTTGRSYRTRKEICMIEKLLQPTSERDMWCVGVLAHQILTGVAPFSHIKLTDRVGYWKRAQKTTLTHPMLSGRSQSISGLLERLLHPNPLLRAPAEVGVRNNWFHDNETRNDNRNLLYVLEQDFMRIEISVYADTMNALSRLRT